MGQQLFSNNATTTLASSITSSATTLSVTSGGGALFPAISAGNWFVATIMHIVSGAVTALEIVLVTARSTDTMTIVRAQEGTTAAAWAAGDTFALLPTAGGLGQFVQAAALQAQAGNYAIDTGSANAYSVSLTPALAAHVVGAPIRFKAANANTGASTFNDGAGSGSLLMPSGSAIAAGAISANGIYTVIWSGSAFILIGAGFIALSAASSFATVASGSFTGTMTGLTTSPTGPVDYKAIQLGGSSLLVALTFGTAWATGTSNSTALGITGLPSTLQPPSISPSIPVATLIDNSAAFVGGTVEILCVGNSEPFITFLKNGSSVGFTASGTKAVPAGTTIVYPLF